jgi:hypothetical protein
MGFEADLVTRTVAIGLPGITADQVSWRERRARGILPAVVLHRISPGRDYTHDGANAFEEPRIQFTILGRSPAEVEAIEKVLVPALEAPATVGDTYFGNGFLNASPDLDPQEIEGGTDGAGKVFWRAPDFTLFHQPA